MSSKDARALVVTARFFDGRYHGEPEWPPAPARLFQALVAGGARAGQLEGKNVAALEWLEGLPPPSIAAPIVWAGQAVKLWVPNNDLDAKGGDPGAVPDLRVGKRVRPRIFDRRVPLVYAWTFLDPEDETHAVRVCEMARELYQLGRGVDMASATGRLMDHAALARLFDDHPGTVHHPSPVAIGRGLTLACPERGSLSSLDVRHEAWLNRFQRQGQGRKAIEVFQQPPKPRFASVAYDVSAARGLFDLRPVREMDAFSATPLARIGPLTEALRDHAAARLAAALPGAKVDIERALIGRAVEGVASVPAERRVRIVPLPSIGHEHADRGVRRVLVEVPSGNPLRADDVLWAFSGLALSTPVGAEVVVTRTDDLRMLERYGAGAGNERYRRWRTVTPAVLPAARRRIEPSRRSEEAKPSAERVAEEARAVHAVAQALRHAGIRAPATRIRVQREPFARKGTRAEAFARGTRFPKERLWHVDVTLRDAVPGPLVIGNGRFLGLGVMESAEDPSAAFAFRITGGLAANASPLAIADALRRAVMARFQKQLGAKRRLPEFVTGHDAEGRPTQGSSRLTFAYDPDGERLLVVAADTLRRGRASSSERRYLRVLATALENFTLLRAGRAGRLVLAREDLDLDCDPLFAPSTRWTSRTPYAVNRHLDRADARAAVAADVQESLRAAGLPKARVHVRDAWAESGAGLMGTVMIEFDMAVPGPLIFGRTRFKGGGVFGHDHERR